MYSAYKINDDHVKDYEQYEQITETIQNRFKTYGFKRIKTSTFEQYDLYSKVRSALRQNEMIKVINRSGEVLVLRPDVTLPITKQLAEEYKELPTELRYFYVQDVFRHTDDEQATIESTQAGIEYFCPGSPAADAEVLALACQTIDDLQFSQTKIEMGHAQFFKQLIEPLKLEASQFSQLKKAIQMKNVVDVEALLAEWEVPVAIRQVIVEIPFLHGNPQLVIQEAKKLVQSEQLCAILTYLEELYQLVTLYGLADKVILDLGLINHMNYYSGVIFQGFVENYGKPVLMGGRYDELGKEFGADLPAIGFACEIEALLEAGKQVVTEPTYTIDCLVVYSEKMVQQSIAYVTELRNKGYSVVTLPVGESTAERAERVMRITDQEQTIEVKETRTTFDTIEQAIQLLG